MTISTGGKPRATPATVVQRDFKRDQGPTKPRAVSLTVDVTNIDETGIADVQRRLDALKSELDAEIGPGLCSVKSY